MSNQTIRAPMACTVVEVTVAAGQAVQAGQTLLVLEAMKMEHELRAERDGQVLRVDTRAGELVAEGAVLMVLGAKVSSVSVDVTAGVLVEVLVRDDGIGMSRRSDSPGLGLGLGLIASMADQVEHRVPPDGGGFELWMSFRLDVA